MSAQKCFWALSGKYSKVILQAFQNKSHLRIYTFMTAEKHELRRLHSSLTAKICASAGIHLSIMKNADKSKDNLPVHPQPLKFENMSFDKPVPHDELLDALHKCKTVSEQMEILASTLGLATDDIRNRVKFCKSLEPLFKPFFHDCKIHIFGSTVNGFGFKGCDLDLSFETPDENFKETITSDENIHKPFDIDEINVPLISEVISGKVTPQDISDLSLKNKLIFMHNLLLEYYQESEDPPIFIDCQVPLVRFKHDKFGLKCDLTLKNKVAFANTKLLYLFNKLDKRVAPFMMTIRYWAKHHEIIGKGMMFNSYTISLLSVYFLQSRNPPIIPSVESILKICDSLTAEDMDDKSFLNALEKIPPSENSQTLEELLREFFFFYSFFDFNRVICAMTASAVPKEEFFSRSENSKFKNNTFCIQDPMCLSHNVADLVKFEFCRKLGEEMLAACNIFLKDDVFKPSLSPWGLINLLQAPNTYLYKPSKVLTFSVPLLSKSLNGNVLDSERISASADAIVKIFEYVFLFNLKTLKTKEYTNLIKKQDLLLDKLQKKAELLANNRLLLRQVVQESLNKEGSVLTDVDVTSTNNCEVRESMSEQFQKLSAENRLVFCAECKISKNILFDRHLVKLETVSDSINVLERERLVSILADKESERRKATKSYLFLCECFVPKDRPGNLMLNFRPHGNEYFNKVLGTFLEEYITKIMKNLDD